MSEDLKKTLRWLTLIVLWALVALFFWDYFLSPKAGQDSTYVKMVSGVSSGWLLMSSFILAFYITLRKHWKLYLGGVVIVCFIGLAAFFWPIDASGIRSFGILVLSLMIALPLTILGVIDFVLSHQKVKS